MTKPLSGKGKASSSKSEKKSKVSGVKKITDVSKHKAGLGDTASGSSTSSPKGMNSKLWSFHSEIAGMMYAFGDCRKPLPETVSLVEEIIHHQMSSVLLQATEITNMRGGRFTSIDDILFLMKNNKELFAEYATARWFAYEWRKENPNHYKLRRVIRYLRLKDLKTKTVKSVASPDEDDVLDPVVGDSSKGDSGKRLKLAYDFISSIDGTGDLIALFDEEDIIDEIKQVRLKRAERMSRCLDSQAYMEYSEARQMSFSKKIGKFKDWLGIGSTIDIKASTAVIEILSYLAYETVNEIVDLALLVKEDEQGGDLVSTNLPVSINQLSEHAKNTAIRQPQIPKGALPTPTHSPPGTPTTQVNNDSYSAPNTLTTPIQGGLASSLGTASLTSSLSGLIKQPKTKKKKTKHFSNIGVEMSSFRIQPSQIREAVRRYTMARNSITPFAGFARSTLSQRTLCL